MQILRARDPQQRDVWVKAWEAWGEREVFAHPAYLQAFTGWSGGEACAAYHECRAGAVLYPFFIRAIPGSTGEDIISPYGYGGPFVCDATDREALAASFWGEFDRWCEDHGVVSEFVRFALEPTDLAPYPGVVEQRSMNVVRGLDLSEEQLWAEVKHKVRKNVKRARADGLSILVDPVGQRLGDFERIYAETMTRRDADESYRFDRVFFESLTALPAESLMFFHATHSDRVVASELVLVSERSVYSFLGGTDPAYFASRPNDLLKYEICLWGMERGKRRFVLGGGKSPDDGIYRYKLAFAPNGATPFYAGRRVLDAAEYERLVCRNAGPAEAGFFPAYRAA